MSQAKANKRIDINSIYNKLKIAVQNRAHWQEKQDALWARIKRTHCDGDREMNYIDSHIGSYTHEINGLVSSLCHYRKAHRAMNLASSYIDKEIVRIARIIDSKNQLIRKVDRGNVSLINSKGYTHRDTSGLKRYVSMKEHQMGKLKAWKTHVDRYLV